jgi:hypothetical protein
MRNGGEHYDVEMQIQDLAEFMFLRNVNNVSIELSLGGIESNKDLFYFLLDLFCKGLVLMFGNGNSVDIDTLNEQNFMQIREKLLCAGLEVTLNMYPSDIEGDEFEATPASINLQEIETAEENKPLNEYEFKVTNKYMIYVVSFNLIHRV